VTGRQRVITALNFKQPDKVPLDFNAHRSSGINVTAYMKLREYLDLPRSPIHIYDPVQQLAVVGQDVLDFFDVDTFQLGCDIKMKSGYIFTPDKVISGRRKKELCKIAAITRDSTDRAIYGDFGGSLFETGCSAFGMENFLCDLLENPGQVNIFLNTVLDRHMENLKAYLEAAGKYIDIIGFNDDMGAQNGTLFSPDIYMDFFFQRQKMMWSYIREHFPEIKICLHCCGSVRSLMPLFAEAGLNAVNPVQSSCSNMDIGELKKEFFGKLALWGGGCDSQNMLPHIKPEEIRAHVNRNIGILNNGGGFVFQPVHNILADMPAENIVQMFKTVREYSISESTYPAASSNLRFGGVCCPNKV